MHVRFPATAVFGVFLALTANSRADVPKPFPLWTEAAPGALGTNDWDVPTLTAYFADANIATGAAMVICPGGGYGHLAEHEGKDYALWLSEHGVHGFVLKYRLDTHGYRHPRMLQDATRAVRLVRTRSTGWGVDPHRVGIMGSSAGGHLAATLLIHFDGGAPGAADPVERESCRPDLGVLCYPVITMGAKTHADSRKNLLGDNPSPELVDALSNERHVTPQTPPCFIWHTYEDTAVPVENSLMFAEALRAAGVPFDLHIYQHGGHGMGLAGGHPWTRDCLYWLKSQGFVR